jgi:hypothetical protein
MSRMRAFFNALLTFGLLLGAAGWLAYSHRVVSVSCQRASPVVSGTNGGKVDCTDTERIADQNFWTQPVWTATVRDVTLTTRAVDDEGNPGAVILRTQNDTQTEQFTSGMLGTNEPKVENELHQFLVVRKADKTLQLQMAPGTTWRDWGVPVALMAVALLMMLYALFRVVVPAKPRAKIERQT